MRKWHIITCEYPPQIGGVSDYTALLSQALRNEGHPVHVWAPGSEEASPADASIYRVLGNFDTASLARPADCSTNFLRRALYLVQWVPHGYGCRSMNVGFCRWLAKRVRRHGDLLQLMVHEPFLEFRGVRQSAAAGRTPLDDPDSPSRRRTSLALDPCVGIEVAHLRTREVANGLAPDSKLNSPHCDA